MATDTVTEPATTAPPRVLVVDDERSMRELLSIVLKRDGYEVLVAEDGVRAIELLKKQRVDILITDIRMPQMSGVDVLREAKNIDPEIISIVMTAFASTDTAVEALRLGAADYVHKSPSAANELRLRVRKELERKHLQRENVLLKRALQSSHKFSNIIGRSDPMLAVFQLIETIAPTSSTVLITRRVGHRQGAGGAGDSLQLAAQGAPVRGAQLRRAVGDAARLGALRPHEGRLHRRRHQQEGAHRGRGEGDDFPRRDRRDEPARPGEAAARAAGAQVPAPGRDRGGRGRHPRHRRHQPRSVEDGRGGDVPRGPVLPHQRHPDPAAGAARARSRTSRSSPSISSCGSPSEMGKTITGISGAAMACLQAYGWPGNIRELENAMERAVALERTPSILVESLPEQVRGAAATAAGAAAPSENFPDNGFDLEQHVQHIEREYIAEALRRAGGVKVKAAELLGMSFRSFRYYMKKYDLK